MASDFVHLHVHTEYSLLDGFSKIPRLVKRAKDIGMPALALTDHGTLFGAIDFFNAATEEGVKPIIGIEAYLSARSMADRDSELDKRSSHLLLLAENQTGYQNLLKIASAAQLEGFYYFPRIDHDFLAAHSEGLIATSGCMSAEIPRALMRGDLDGARKKLDWYYEVFGPENFFLELQHHDIPELPALNKALLEMGARYKANFVATNDVHYVNEEDARLQDILLCIQTSSLLNDPKRMRMTDQSYYLRTAEEMAALFGEIPGALKNTVLIAERCEVDLKRRGYHLPEFDVPEGYTPQSYLRELCEAGLLRRYGERASDPEIRERLDYELKIINKMGFDAYFLIVWDLCRYAKQENIWYNARGSAAGSIVAYSLDITLVDPIEHGLLFERFLNPDRISMPDIDLDFQDDLRYKIMEYCAQRYGEDKVAAIITFGKLKARAAVRDVARVMDIPLNEVDRIAKMIPNIPGKPVTIDEALETIPEFRNEYQSRSYVKDLIDTAKEMEGVIRNAGTHAAGVVITDKPIVEYIPLHRPTGNTDDTPIKTVTQFEMSTVDALGLLKVDFLGLSTLTIMARACELIEQRHNVKYDLHTIPVDDPRTFKLLGDGDTAGVFQFEGSGMRRWMMEMKPESLDNAIAMVALFRPGPMEFIPTYIQRMHGEEEVSYRHPLLGELFEETYGIAVYQEQVMLAAMQLAGYTGAEADDLRKAISKKLAKSIEKHRRKFVKGAVNNQIAKDTAEQIFHDWENFARYGFNKSHAADYGVIAVQTAFLKANYPVEYMAALLSVTKDNTDKIAFYVADCRRMDIDVLAPDINRSDWDFTIEDGKGGKGGASAIRFGLGAVKNVGYGPVEAILAARRKGKFKHLYDFARRVDLRQVGKRAMECLIKVGAFDPFGQRIPLLEVMEQVISISSTHFRAVESGQMTFFGGETGMNEQVQVARIDDDFNRRERLNWERDLVGLYLSDHPLSPMKEELDEVVSHYTGQLSLAEHGEVVRVAGIVTRIRHHTTKKGDPMAFVGLEDMEGVVELVVFPRTWAQSAQLFEYDKVIIVDGKIDAQNSEPKILVDKVYREISVVAPLEQPPPSAIANPRPAKKNAQPAQAVVQVAENNAAYSIEGSEAEEPPPPEAFPPAWVEYWDEDGAEHEQAEAIETEADPEDKLAENTAAALTHPEMAPAEALYAAPESDQRKSAAAEAEKKVAEPQNGAKTNGEDRSPLHSYIVPPSGEVSASTDAPRIVTIYIHPSGDQARDILRLRRIHGLLISNPGRDRFAFYVLERNRQHLLEFPNENTNASDELQARLKEVVGAENVQIEPIAYR